MEKTILQKFVTYDFERQTAGANQGRARASSPPASSATCRQFRLFTVRSSQLDRSNDSTNSEAFETGHCEL